MDYYVIEEIKIVGGEIIRTPFGHTTDVAMSELAIADGQPVFNWVEANKEGLEDGTVNPSDTFDESQSCFAVAWITTSVDSDKFPEITDFSFLVGVN